MSLWLLHSCGREQEGMVWALGNKEFSIGRKSTCSLHYRNPSLSAVHCRFSRPAGDAQSLLVEDCSSNGTYLNGRLLDKGERAVLGDGDVVALLKPRTQRYVPRFMYRIGLSGAGAPAHASGGLSCSLDDEEPAILPYFDEGLGSVVTDDGFSSDAGSEASGAGDESGHESGEDVQRAGAAWSRSWKGKRAVRCAKITKKEQRRRRRDGRGEAEAKQELMARRSPDRAHADGGLADAEAGRAAPPLTPRSGEAGPFLGLGPRLAALAAPLTGPLRQHARTLLLCVLGACVLIELRHAA